MPCKPYSQGLALQVDIFRVCDIRSSLRKGRNPRPAKRRKPRSAPAVTPTTSRGHIPELHVGQPSPLVALSTTTPEIDDAQPQVDHECPSTFVDNSHHHTSRPSRSPSMASEIVHHFYRSRYCLNLHHLSGFRIGTISFHCPLTGAS